jgi:1-acyl-sn-glycerol-3-phosphate acyltransferase
VSQIDYARHNNNVFRFFVYPISKVILGVFFFLFGTLKVSGRKNVPPKGSLLILANHISDLDPAAIGFATPRPVWFMAKSELFEMPMIKWIVKMYRAFPVKRGKPDRYALRKAAELLEQEQAVVMFPEGQLSEDGQLQEILPGAALVIRLSNSPVICAGISGTQNILPFRAVLPRPAFRKVHIHFGQPKQFDKSTPEQEITTWITEEFKRLTSPS